MLHGQWGKLGRRDYELFLSSLQEEHSLFFPCTWSYRYHPSYDLCRHGHQALDLGHMDIEYEWYKMGATSKVPVTGKFSNEAAINLGLASEVMGSLQSAEYEEQIVAEIG